MPALFSCCPCPKLKPAGEDPLITTRSGRAPVLAAALVGVPAGAAVQLMQATLWTAQGWAVCAGCALAALIAACGSRRWPGAGWRVAIVFFLAAALCSFTATGVRALAYAGHALPQALEGRDLVAVGTIASMPQWTATGQRFEFEVESVQGAMGQPLHGPWLLAWYSRGVEGEGGATEVLRAGDRWRLGLRLRAPHGQLNPHGHDHELQLWDEGLHATGYVLDRPPAARISEGGWGLQRLRQHVRDAIFARVADPAQAGVIAALVVGDQRAITRSDWDVFRATGVAHLVSISGLHVTLFAWCAAAMVGAGWRRSQRLSLAWPAQHAGLVGGILFAIGYALFSGWGVPAQRTVWMLVSMALLRLSGRRWPWPLVWLAAMAVVVCIDPWALLQAGFWLSFVAVGILFASGRTEGAHWRRLLREQAIVTLALAPLTLLLFGQMSLVSLPANLLAIPWVTLVVTPLGMAGVVLAPAWDAAAWAVQAMGWVLCWLAEVPAAVWTSATPPLPLAVIAMAGALLLVLRLPTALRMLGLPLLLPVLLWQTPRPPPGEFEVLAVDVGQGGAALVRTAGHGLLYDTGPRWGPESEAGSRVLVPLLRSLGERLDTVVVSHRDSDHSGGADAIRAAQPEAQWWLSYEAPHLGRAARPCMAGQAWEWDGVRFEFLHPQPRDYGAAGLRPNAMSCVLRVSARAGTGPAVLLTGDIELAQERRLMQDTLADPMAAALLRADLLLVPHHGSRTSSSAAFIEAVAPRLAVVQAGWRNRFGHPVATVVQRYGDAGVPVHNTATCGAATWSSMRPDVAVCERERRRRYWHHRP